MIGRFRDMGRMISMLTMMAQDAPARPGLAVALAAAFLSFIVPALLAPHPAQAQLQFVDPSAMAFSTAQGWIGTAKSIANGIFGTLIVLEFTFFGIQFALFRENLTDILGSMALKVITTGFFLWLISQADTLFPAVINSFTQSANQMTGNGGASSSLLQIAGEVFAACALMYGSAALAQFKQQLVSYFSGFFSFGTGFAGQANGAPVANTTNILLEQVIIFLLISSLAVILMQWVITNIESYIVMFGGIIFLGFTGSRWTMPFAQGYLSYAINVGAKLFTLYLVLAIEANLAFTVLLPVGTAAALIAADPTGVAGPAAIALMFWAAIQVSIMAAVAYSVPNLTGSFLSGQSSMSGAQALGTMTSTMASIRMANAANHAGQNAAGREANIGAQQASMNAPMQGGRAAPDESTGAPPAVVPVGPLGGASTSANANAASPMAGSIPGQNGSLYNNGIVSAANADAAPVRGSASGQNGSLYTMANGSPSQSSPRVDSGAQRVSVPAAASIQAPAPISAQTASPPPPRPTDVPDQSSDSSDGLGSNTIPPASTAPGYVAPPMVGGTPAQTANAMALNAMAQQTAGSAAPSGQQGIDFNNLAAATPLQGRASVGRDPIETLTPDQWNQIPAATRAAMADEMKNQMATLEAQKEQSQAYAMQLLAQALPRDGGPPAAVQVRLSSPDKL